MAWSVFADTYDSTSELSSGTKYVPAQMNKNILLRYVRTWVVLFNEVNVSGLVMTINHDNNGTKGPVIYTSTNGWTNTQITTLKHAIREIYFEFDDVPLDALTTYNFTLVGTSTNTGDFIPAQENYRFFAWKNAYPYPVHRGGFSLTAANLPKYPYDICLIGAEF